MCLALVCVEIELLRLVLMLWDRRWKTQWSLDRVLRNWLITHALSVLSSLSLYLFIHEEKIEDFTHVSSWIIIYLRQVKKYGKNIRNLLKVKFEVNLRSFVVIS